MNKISLSIKKIFFKNFFNLSLNQGTNIVVALISTPILFQNLGEDNFGIINLCLSIISIMNIMVSYGYHLNGPKRVAIFKRENKKISDLVNEIVSTRLLISILLVITMIIVSLLFDFFSGYRVVLFFSLICLFREALLPDFYLQGMDNFFHVAVTNSLSKIIYLILILIFINSPKDSYLVYFFFGISSIFVSLSYWTNIYLKRDLIWFRTNFFIVFKNLKENFKFFLSSIAGHISLHGAILLLANFVQNSELGKFALAHRVAFLVRMIPTFFIQSILQKASVLNISDSSSLKKTLNKYYIVGLLITLIVAFLFIIFSKYIIYILSGEFILLSQQILNILGFIPFLAMLNFKNMINILVDEKQDVLYKSTWISSIIMLITCAIGCFYNGSIGLAYSLLFSEFISFIVHSLLLSKVNNGTK